MRENYNLIFLISFNLNNKIMDLKEYQCYVHRD